MPGRSLTSHCSSSPHLHINTTEIADRYEPQTSLRSALFGEILLCRDRLTLDRVIVKTVDLQLARRQTSRKQELVQENVQLEVEGLNRVRALGGHPNIIKLHRCFVTKGVLHLVLDYCEGGDLLDACVQRRCSADDRKKTKRRSGTSSCKSSRSSRNRSNCKSDSSNSSTGCGCSDGSCGPREDASAAVEGATLVTDDELSPEDDDEEATEDDGPLRTGVDGSKRLQETVAHKYLVDVLSGLRFLHSHGIAHRDVSLENILLRNGCAVLADFGLCVPELSSVSTSSLSRTSWSHQTTAGAFYCDETVGKDYYMAPEIVARKRYDPRRADIWATGIAFFILLTSSPPFERADPLDPGFRYVAKCGIQAVFTAWGLDQDVSEAMQDLLTRMLCVNPEERITMAEIWQHPRLRRPMSSMLSTGGCR
uniref:Protein kinase domain-containing protein n=1 Tax=Peronospora matthiolae TaxID=2874970 RepID=A0AAV1U6Y9_9STRA